MKKTVLHFLAISALTVSLLGFVGCGSEPAKHEETKQEAPAAPEQPAAQPADSAAATHPADSTHKH